MHLSYRGATVFLVVLSAVAQRGAVGEGPVGYRRDVLPILSDRCFKCHGPDSATRKAGLRLDPSDSARAVLDSGANTILAGKTAQRALALRIMSKDPDEMMPPPDSGKVLSDTDRTLLRRWIEQGAK